MTGSEGSHVVVAVCTIGDPSGCSRTVRALLRQELSESVTVLVVDNNLEPRVSDLPPGVVVVHEPRAGVAHARNAAVSRSLAMGAETLVFIDDDEEPSDERWLAKLLGGLAAHDAAGATGPVLPEFPKGTPAWIARHPVFWHRRLRDGASVREAATNNLALRNEVFADVTPWFDVRFDMVGGEDTEFTRRVAAAGYEIAWIDQATVSESVPASRSTVRWILRRSWRIGSNRFQRSRLGTPGELPLVLLLPASVLELLVGFVGAAATGWFSRRLLLVALGRAARGMGCLAAMLGFQYREYAGRAS